MTSRPCASSIQLVMKQVLAWIAILLASQVAAAGLEVVEVRSSNASNIITTDGVVEAVRQTVIAAQVSGAITDLPAKAGDNIQAGQVLTRLDGRAANQQARASQAQVEAARASLQVASKDYERQKQLFSRQYISQAQLDRAEAQFKSATADANSLIAQAGAVQTQSGFYNLTAPYSGRIADVYVSQGDMVTPGKALMAVFDPSALRVTTTLPEAQLARLAHDQAITIEIPALPTAQRLIKVDKFIVLPVTDASTHTVQLRLALPSVSGLAPGMFARLQFPAKALGKDDNVRLYVPAKAVIRRAELYAVYVINPQGKPMLRQIKPGAVSGSEQEVLAGVSAGEKVLVNPLSAAQSR